MTVSPQFWWYVSRASGITSWLLLTASLVWGVLLFTRALRKIDTPWWLLDMHSWLSGLAMVTMVLHLGALVADNYVHFSWSELLVPGASSWRKLPVALGVVSLWILVAVQGTSLVRKHISRRFWKWVHLGSYAAWWLVSLHAGLAGSDVTNRVYQVVAGLATLVAAAATVLRIVKPRRSRDEVVPARA